MRFRHQDGLIRIPLYAVLAILDATHYTEEGGTRVLLRAEGEYRSEPQEGIWDLLYRLKMDKEAEEVWNAATTAQQRRWMKNDGTRVITTASW